MGVIIHSEPPRPSTLVADRRLYLTRDRETLVEEGDVTAGYLLSAPGLVLPLDEVQRLGLSVVNGRVVQLRAEPVVEVVAEAAPAVVPATPSKKAHKKP